MENQRHESKACLAKNTQDTLPEPSAWHTPSYYNQSHTSADYIYQQSLCPEQGLRNGN